MMPLTEAARIEDRLDELWEQPLICFCVVEFVMDLIDRSHAVRVLAQAELGSSYRLLHLWVESTSRGI